MPVQRVTFIGTRGTPYGTANRIRSRCKGEDVSMSTGRHAGFASVVSVGADFVNGMLAAAATLAPSPTFTLPSVVVVGGQTIGLAGSLTVVPPTVSFAANPGNLIGVAVGASGTVRFTSGGSDLVEVEVTLTATLQVGLILNVSATNLSFGVDLSSASVTAVDVAVDFGPPLALIYQDALQDGSVLGALSTALQSIPQSALTFTIPGATGTLAYTIGSVTAQLTVSNAVVIPLDGVLDVALDVAGYTAGDPTQLVNLITTPGPSASAFIYDQYGNESFSPGLFESHSGFGINLAATVNAAFLVAVVNGPINSLIAGTSISGVTINSLSISIGEVESVIGQSNLPTNFWGSLSAGIDGSYSSIGFTFNASVTPVSIERPTDAYWDFTLVAYSYSSALLAILDVLFPFVPVIGPLVLNSTIASLIANVIASLPTVGFAAQSTEPVPHVPGWSIAYSVADIALWDPELDVYVAAGVNGPPSLSPPPPMFQLYAAPHGLTDPSPIPVTLTVSDPALLDPLLGLRIAWNAVRDDTGATVLSQDTALDAADLAIEIDRWTGDLTYNDTWTVSCEVYRPADSLTPRYTYFSQSVSAGVSDVVDRHHPYVHWDHVAYFHEPYGPPPLKSHPFWTRSRHSRIHRTDLLIRCEILDMVFSRTLSTPEYLDSIASHGSFGSVDRWRHGVLCDYCFFGGPTRTVWKTPTHPTPDFV